MVTSRYHISVKGVVQGVGFRPFIYNLARTFKLKGYVTNTSEGVIIEVEGDDAKPFVESIRDNCPPLARIYSIEITELPPKGFDDFVIVDSLEEGGFTHISPDISVCDDCLKELFDPGDRRYLYPFINCTNCGPRYSITKKVPYDRPNTTMAVFEMCPACSEEYHDPANRRFHAQPNACPVCGPRATLAMGDPASPQGQGISALDRTICLIREGAIVAIKGLGGFHLCCDAENEEAVAKLRERKRRRNKPFALMAPDVESIRSFCEVSEEEALLLKDRRRPIVLMSKGMDLSLPDDLAPKNKYLGFMLPYTPLHYLLFYQPSRDVIPPSGSPLASRAPLSPPLLRGGAHFTALVMTSGNLSEEPIVIDNGEALAGLSEIADAYLLHNRDIFMRVDDSVLRCNSLHSPVGMSRPGDLGPRITFVRRSRGFVPEGIPLGEDGPDVLGCGADLKNTFTITKGDHAIVSQHIGDMENLETVEFFGETLSNLKQVYRAEPVAIVHDLHPGYLSTQWALRHSGDRGITSYGVQHHYAHIASVMAENGLKEKVIGVAFDGTGYGTDGNLWGSEFLLCDLREFTRAGHFRYIPLPGGEQAIRECWRTAVSYVADALGGSGSRRDAERGAEEDLWSSLESIGFIERYGRRDIANILRVLSNRQFSPQSSGAGRLFDAVSAIAGVCDRNTFEGEAAIALESLLPDGAGGEPYAFDISDSEPLIIDFARMIRQIIGETRSKKNRGLISLRFHNTLIGVIKEVVSTLGERHGIMTVALSGGVFQNACILDGVIRQLSSLGFHVYRHNKLPPNDGCISLGQAYVIRERLKDHAR